ncbi:MAG: hypothetical protein ACJ76V_01980 [Thermoleophilaceae bacterium]
MATEGEIDRVLASITTTLSEQKPETLDPSRVQHIVNDALGAPQEATQVHVTPAGPHEAYVFDGSKRVGEIKRSDGRWHASRTA